jgi:hypothetical protein
VRIRVLLATVAAAVTLAACGSSTPFPTTSPPTVHHTAPPTTIAETVSVAAQIGAWWSEYNGTLTAIVNDAEAISTDAKAYDTIAVGADCQTLLDDVNSIDPSGLPTGISSSLRAGLEHFAASARACLNGDYSTAGDEANAASTYLDDATQQIKELG